MGGNHKRPPEVDNEDGTFSVAGFRYIKFGTRIKIYLDILTSSKVGCHCMNPDKWTNAIEKLNPQQKLVFSKGTTRAYNGYCASCKVQAAKKSKKEGQAKAEKKKRETRGQGEKPRCTYCPDGMVSKFTKEEDGTFFVPCVYHRLAARRTATNLWEFKQTLIDPKTQALCKKCTDIFTLDQMRQEYYNVRGQFTFERLGNFCPTHYARHKEKAKERREEHRRKLIQEMLAQLEFDATDRIGCAHEQCHLNRQQLCEEFIRRHDDDKGIHLFASSFDCDHEPRRADRKDVCKIFNDILRAK